MANSPLTPTFSLKAPNKNNTFFSSSNPSSPIRSTRHHDFNDISIRIDPASAEMSRSNSEISFDHIRHHNRFIHNSSNDRDLLRRQHAMIAVQPRTTMEEIEENRRLLRMKVENRKRVDEIVKASNSLGKINMGSYRDISRSPSPANPAPPSMINRAKSRDTKFKTNQLQLSQPNKKNITGGNNTNNTLLKQQTSPRKGPKNATQAAKVTKKIVTSNNNLKH